MSAYMGSVTGWQTSPEYARQIAQRRRIEEITAAYLQCTSLLLALQRIILKHLSKCNVYLASSLPLKARHMTIRPRAADVK